MTAAWSQRDFLGVSPTAVPSTGVASQREQLLIYCRPLVIRDVSSFRLGDEVMAQSWTLQSGREHGHHQVPAKEKVSYQIEKIGAVTCTDPIMVLSSFSGL